MKNFIFCVVSGEDRLEEREAVSGFLSYEFCPF